MKYIIYASPDGDRKIVIINSQPYYQSTGQNSKMEGIWLPFIACSGLKQLDLDRYIPKYTREYTLSVYSEGIGHIIKKTSDDIADSKEDEPQWCQLALLNKQKMEPHSNSSNYDKKTDEYFEEEKEKEKKIESGFTLNNIFNRLFLKNDLVNSLRLSDKSIWPEISDIYKQAALDTKQIELSKNSLELDGRPELITNNPDEINTWLIKNGASYIEKMIRQFPLSYQKIWDKAGSHYKPLIESKRNSSFITDQELADKYEQEMEMELKQVKAILNDYTKSSAIMRFFTIHSGRHHIDIVSQSLKNNKLNTAISLITEIRCRVGDNLKLDGSLEKRLTFMEQELIVNKEKSKNAILHLWIWQTENGKPLAYKVNIKCSESPQLTQNENKDLTPKF